MKNQIKSGVAVFAKLVMAMMPFILFGLIYDSMRYYPNYLFGEIDIQGIYEAEKSLFGIGDGAARLTPNEWFAAHATPVADLLAGVFYLCWVPLPVVFGFYLFFSGRRELAFRFAAGFLFVNLIGFIGYYIHPAAPPWYVQKFGFEPLFDTGGDTAGLGRFDALVGYPVFGSIYVNNSNVFAAVPSLHAAYCPIACFYALRTRRLPGWSMVLAIVSLGIWWTAIYSGHHYTIDVLLGILTTIIGLTLYEGWLTRTSWWQHFSTWYARFYR
ncbi:MAG: inositol phosphorylceramide synthase [Bacteroidaceae bacterium]|nr:inositol phosphorylceramide synthase [Bacteroidaceae bacterium]